MQLSAPEVADLRPRDGAIRKLYGTDDPNPLKAAYARNCLLARRFLERGVALCAALLRLPAPRA